MGCSCHVVHVVLMMYPGEPVPGSFEVYSLQYHGITLSTKYLNALWYSRQ